MKKAVLFLITTTGYTALFASYVLIDPGHGGKFEGCLSASGNTKEKDLTLIYAKQLAQELKKFSVESRLTREIDKDFVPEFSDPADPIAKEEDIKRRFAKAKQQKPSCAISIHFNSAKNTDIRGTEIYVPYSSNGNLQDKSYQLACKIHQKLTKILPHHWTGNLGNINSFDRGIRAAKLTLFEAAPCPTVLIEIDYLTNFAAELWVKKQKNVEQLTQTIALAIDSFLKNTSI